MNCKQNDLAIVVRSSAGNEGRVLTCLRLATLEEKIAEDLGILFGPVPCWVTDRLLNRSNAIMGGVLEDDGYIIPDSYLKPLRGGPGQDETLDWVPVPSREAA